MTTSYIIIAVYTLCLSYVLVYSFNQFDLALNYLKGKKKRKSEEDDQKLQLPDEVPVVTVQLPIYNELYVVERLIDCVCQFDYPKDKLEVQILDDSDDETVKLVAEKVKVYQDKGVDIKHVRRPERVGFKAGALQYGVEHSRGEYLAVFDADFLPEKNFLKSTIPHFANEKIGMVQTCWGHINTSYSLLTKMQAFGLDAHFSVEQNGRLHAGSFINFNGTAGVWKKECIKDAGGWSFDTLTEDLDLSYRAQLKGWKFKYLEDIKTPAELPVVMSAIKSQQFRWNKGGAECARKNLKKIWKTPKPFRNKIHSIFHLLNSSVYFFMLFAAILSIPTLFIKSEYESLALFFQLASVFLSGFLGISFFYYVSTRQQHSFKYYIQNFPVFLSVSMGLSLINAVAVIEGFLGIKSPFIRTPKFNILKKNDNWKGNKYVRPSVSLMTIFEGLFSLYFLFGIIYGISLGDYGLVLFHGMLATGFAIVFYYSVRPYSYAKA